MEWRARWLVSVTWAGCVAGGGDGGERAVNKWAKDTEQADMVVVERRLRVAGDGGGGGRNEYSEQVGLILIVELGWWWWRCQ